MNEKEIKKKKVVKERYAQIAKQAQESCCPSWGLSISLLAQAEAIGYSKKDLKHILVGAIMG